MRGFAALPITIIVVVILILGAGIYTVSQDTSPTLEPTPAPTLTQTPTETPSPTVTPKLSVKPTLKPTIKPTVKPTLPPEPTPTPAPKTGCAEYNPGGDLGTLKVTIQAAEGQSLVGDAAVKIYRKYAECQGVDPGFPLIQIISQGSTSTTFSGMRPGPFKIDVGYHGKNSTHDVGINSGENSTTVTVSE